MTRTGFGAGSLPWFAAAVLLLWMSPAHGQDAAQVTTIADSQRNQIEQLRAELSRQIQLRAYDLVDELVFAWKESPPFATPTAVVLGDVVAPVGYGSGLEVLIENHLAQLLINNTDTHVRLAHCPSCNAIVVHSDANGTVIGRGVDQPDALAILRGHTGAEHALFLDFEAEGTALVLRARVTRLADDLPIVYARSLSSQTGTAPMLRSPTHLVSADEARREYIAILEQRGPIKFPMRMALNVFAPSQDSQIEVPVPVPLLEVGVELGLTTARAWTGSLSLGASYIPDVITAGMIQARVSRLLSGSTYSLIYPNLYGFLGITLMGVQGSMASLLDPEPNPVVTEGLGPLYFYPSIQTGLEVRIADRIGAAIYAETMPTLYNAENIGSHMDIFGIRVQSVGAEATFAF